MELLASLYVGLVSISNLLAPQANLPKILGVKIAQDTTQTLIGPTESSTNSGTVRNAKVRQAIDAARLKRRSAEERFLKNRREASESAKLRREEFKEKLSTIRSEQKQRILENLDSKLANVNTKWVEAWNKALARLTEILAKVSSRADEAAAGGKDVTVLRTAITNAETAIADAQELVNAQAAKAYVIEISDEQGVGQDAKSLISQYKTDIQSTKEAVKEAKGAVQATVRVLKSIAGEATENE